MIEEKFKHRKRMNKLVKEIRELEEALGVINNEYRTKADAFAGIKSRREEIERLNKVIAGSDSMESFKKIDKEFSNVENDLKNDFDKFQDLSFKLAEKALQYEELYKESLDLLIQNQIKASEEVGAQLLELRAKQVKIQKERDEIQTAGREYIGAYNEKFGNFAYEMDLEKLRLLGFQKNSIYGKWRVV